MARPVGKLRLTLNAIGLVVALLLVLVLVLSRIQIGSDFMLDQLQTRSATLVQGEVVIGGVSSANLFEGLVLRRVTVADAEGNPVLAVDSARVQYSALRLLLGSRALGRVDVWGPTLTVRAMSDGSNSVAATFNSDSSSSEPALDSLPMLTDSLPVGSVGTVFAVADLRIHDGRVRWLDPRGMPIAASGRPELRVEALQVRISDLAIGSRAGDRIDIASLGGRLGLRGGDLVIRDAEAVARRNGQRLEIDIQGLATDRSRSTGTMVLEWGEHPLQITVDAAVDELDLEEARVLFPELPSGTVQGQVHGRIAAGSSTWDLDGVVVRSGASRAELEGTVELRDGVRFTGLTVSGTPIELGLANRWLEAPALTAFAVAGRLRLDGRLGALAVEGAFDVFDRESPDIRSRVSVDGALALGNAPGARGLHLVVDALDYRLLRLVDSELDFEQLASADILADGALDSGLEVSGTLGWDDGSVVDVAGMVQRLEGDWGLDLTGELRPLRLARFAAFVPDVPLSGELRGQVAARGSLRDLMVTSDLSTSGGPVSLQGRFDLTDPFRAYEFTADLSTFDASRLSSSLPSPTVISGRVSFAGGGRDRNTLAGTAELDLNASRVGRFDLSQGLARATIENGVARVDTLWARSPMIDFEAKGTLALADSAVAGEMHVAFVTESLGAARPFLLGDSVIAGDTLSDLERQFLLLDGIDPDTLPDAEAVRMDGRARGDLVLTGSVLDFDAEGTMDFSDVVYGPHAVDSALVDVTATGLPRGRLQASIEAGRTVFFERDFERFTAEVDYGAGRGGINLFLARNASEDLRAQARVERDSTLMVVHLDQAFLRMQDVRWNLGGPADFLWDEAGLTVRDLRIVRPGGEGLRLAASGTLPRRGDADFSLDVERLDLARLAGVTRFLSDRVQGLVDLHLDVRGTAREPIAQGRLSGTGVRFESVAFDRLEGDVGYARRELSGDIQAWQGRQRVIDVEGTFPVDLALTGAPARLPEAPIDVRVAADSFPLAGALGFLPGVERVGGWLDGEFTIRGTPGSVEPAGTVRVSGGVARITELGISPREVSGDLILSPDGKVQVNLEGRSLGSLRVLGSVDLNPLTDPSFDLKITGNRFVAANRRDVTARLSGDVTLEGSYRRPLVSGDLRADQGALFLDEFVRAAGIVDLSDPAFFTVVDTTLNQVRPIFAARQNPFLQNLRTDVTVSLLRDTWLRSETMNVEIGGELNLIYDRTNRYLVMLGDLDAIRGSYRFAGRQFEVQNGTVSFAGTPGVNPNLGITAVNRLRTTRDEPINITAGVSGTLLAPRITLTSDQPGLSESDLVSYLIFGRPSYALAQGESALIGGGGAAGSLLNAAGGAGSTLLLGTIADRLGASLAEEIGFFDYLSIRTAQGTPGGSYFASEVASTEVSLGRYLSQDVFFGVVLRPLSGVGSGGGGADRFAGGRVEWRFADQWTFEGFAEDRFSRARSTGFSDLGFTLDRVYGVFLYHDFGY